MKSRSQKGALSHTYHSGQYRSQQNPAGSDITVLYSLQQKGEKKIFSLPGNNSANGKSLYFKLPVSSNEIFVYKSSSQFPLLLYKSLLSFENWACTWFPIVPCPKLQLFQFSSVAQLCPTLYDPMHGSTSGLSVHHQLPEFTQAHVHWVGEGIQPSHPLSSPSPPALNLSQHQGLFKWVSSSHQVAKVLEFQLQHQSFSEHPGLICFRMDWLDLLAVWGTLKSLLQHHSSKASILQPSTFFMVQLAHPYMTTGKSIALIRQTFVGKVMSLLSNMLSRLIITFLPTRKHLLISWLQSPSAVILEP